MTLVKEWIKKKWKKPKETPFMKDLSNNKQCDYCKESFPIEDLHQILQGNRVGLFLCDSCLNLFCGHGGYPLDEEVE